MCMTTGEMLSITSAGTPRMPLGKAVADSPSSVGRALIPLPCARGSTTSCRTERR